MRLFFFIISIIFLGEMGASPIGNLASPVLIEEGIFFSDKNWASLRLEGGVNILFNQNFKILSPQKSFFKKSKGYEGFFSLIFNAKERFDGAAVFGVGEYKYSFSSKSHQYHAKIESDPFVQVSGKILLWEVGDFSFCFGGAASWVLKKTSWAKITNSFALPSSFPCSFKKRDWQTAFALSYFGKYLSPYVGITVYDAKGRFSVNQTPKLRMKVEAKEKVGPFLGVSFTPRRWFFIDVELMTLTEKNLSIKLDLRF